MELINLAIEKSQLPKYKSSPLLKEVKHSIAVNAMPTLHWYQVTSLGFGSEGAEVDKKETSSCEIDAAAELFAASGVPFSILCERSEQDNRVVYALGCEDELTVPSVLKSAFGTAKYSTYVPRVESETGRYAKDFCPVRINPEELDKQDVVKQLHASEWVKDASRILSQFPGMIRLDFYPVTPDQCFSLLEKAYENNDSISEYLESNIQVSDSIAYVPEGDLAENAMKLVRGDKDKTNRSGSTSVSWKHVDVRLSERKQEEILNGRLLANASKDGWTIDFTISADVGSISSHERDSRCDVLGVSLSAAIVKAGYTCVWDHYNRVVKKAEVRGLVLPTSLVKGFISFPTTSFCGFERVKNRFYNVNVPQTSDDIPLAEVLQFDGKTGMILSLPREQVNRHVFVCGMTGSGKTNTVHHLLSSIGNLPYLVIEPVKGEYHSLPDVRAYTMTAGSEQALRLNPFWFPEGSSLQYHIDCLKQIISSAFDLYAAMPNILEQCLNLVYQHCGWDFVRGKNIYSEELPEEMLYPTFSDLCHEIENYLDRSNFGEELKGNYRGALLSRMQSFTSGAKGELLNTTEHISFAELEQQKIVISLDSLADDADKAIAMGVILAQYYEYRKVQCRNNKQKELKHITVIEEAHHLFAGDSTPKNVSSEGGGSNASQDFVKTLNNMLAEIRAYGEGFIIVDQSPSALHPAVLKNTGVKIVHRVDYGQDIEAMREVLLLEKDDRELAALTPGQALLRFGGMHISAKVAIPRCNTKEDSEIIAIENIDGNSVISILLEDKEMSQYIKKNVVERLLNQLIFDTVEDLQKTYQCICQEITQALVIFGHSELIDDLMQEKLWPDYIGSFFADTLDVMLPLQYCTSKMIRMYSIRLLTIIAEAKGCLSEVERRAFMSYRENRIWPRMNQFFAYSNKPRYMKAISVLEKTCPEISMVCQLTADMKNLASQWDDHEQEFEYILLKAYFLHMPSSVCIAKLFAYVMCLIDVI